MKNKYYIYIDADNIGDKLELLIILDRLDEACTFSRTLSSAMKDLCSDLEKNLNADILLFGGDDIIASIESEYLDIDKIELIRKSFYKLTNCTISCGISLSVQDALQNLRIAKLNGRNQIEVS